jgi:hypothetical protein
MLVKVALVLAVVVGAPVLGILVEIVGCVGPEPLFGVMCGHNAPYVVLPLTFIFWFILGSIVIFLRRDRT